MVYIILLCYRDLQATIDVNEGAGGRLGQLQNKLKEANMRLEKMSQAGHGKPGPVLPQIQQPLEFIETGTAPDYINPFQRGDRL